MEFSPSAPVVLLSPHLDDAVLGAWSVLGSERAVAVVNVFAGVPKPGFVTVYDRLTGAEESASLVRRRLAEDREALALGEREPITLSFLDGQYLEGDRDSDAVATEIRSVAPQASALYVPAGLGGHADHVQVRDLGFAITDPAVPLLLYADLPYAVDNGWPHWVTGEEPAPHLRPDAVWDHYLESVPCGRELLEPEVVRLSDRESDEKLAAMRTYRTQFPSLDSGVVERLTNPAIRRYEVFWRVRSGR